MSLSKLASSLAANDGFGYLVVHALQFGSQPLLVQRCVPPDVSPGSLVLAAEAAKFVGCLAMLQFDGRASITAKSWKSRDFLVAAGLPSLTYVAQNYCIQIAYQHLDGVTFNILNQSKLLFTALSTYMLLGRRQSPLQCLALLMVTATGVLVSISEGFAHLRNGGDSRRWFLGVACAAAAAFFSGLGSGLVELSLRRGRDSRLLSAEMAALGCLYVLLGSVLLRVVSRSGEQPRKSMFANWRPRTIVPVLTQGLGGIIVGLVTQLAGGVRKGFAVASGLVLTCLLRILLSGSGRPSPAICSAVPLVALSAVLHARHPPQSR